MGTILKFWDLRGREHEAQFRDQRAIPDKRSQLLRFQIFRGEHTFAFDVMIGDRLIQDYGLTPEILQRICVLKIGRLVARGMREYCMTGVSKEDIAACCESLLN